MKRKPPKPYRKNLNIHHWILQLTDKPKMTYVRFLEPDDYTIVRNSEEAHVVTGTLDFARGFCLAVSLTMGVSIHPVFRPPMVKYKQEKPLKTTA